LFSSKKNTTNNIHQNSKIKHFDVGFFNFFFESFTVNLKNDLTECIMLSCTILLFYFSHF